MRNEDEYRKKVLEGFGVEYTDDDINQMSLFREKVVEGLASGSGGGGGSSWQTVFEGSVTTELEGDYSIAFIENITPLTKDTIKVTFNGTEYECAKNPNGSYGAVMSGGTYDWSEYPFYVFTEDGGMEVGTQTAGTYTLKIEEPQSGGESDFSTAEVTVTITAEDASITLPVVMSSPQEGLGLQTLSYGTAHNGLVVNIALYKGVTITIPTVGLGNLAVTGNAEINNGTIIITGDCAITIS